MERAVALFLIFAAAIVFAAPPEPPLREHVQSALRDFADRVDDLFGTERTDENKAVSTLRLYTQNQWPEGGPNETAFSARWMFKPATLIQWEKDLEHWFNRWWSGRAASNPSAATGAGADGGDSENPWRFSLEHKVALNRENPYAAQARLSRDFEGHALLHHFTWDAGWSVQAQWDSQMSVISARQLSARWLLQFTNAVDWQISQTTFTTSHGPSLTYMIAPYRALSLAASVGTAVQARNWSAESYAVTATYRLRAIRDWIFVSVNPALTFARANRFYRDPGVMADLEMVF